MSIFYLQAHAEPFRAKTENYEIYWFKFRKTSVSRRSNDSSHNSKSNESRSNLFLRGTVTCQSNNNSNLHSFEMDSNSNDLKSSSGAVSEQSSEKPPVPPDNQLLLVDEQKMDDIEKPHHNDVLCGRGVTTNRHPGNESFRSLVGLNKVRILF